MTVMVPVPGDGTEVEVVTVLNESEERAVRSSLSSLLSSIGELRKYEITLQEFQNQSADWSQVITWYQEAVSMSPLDGTFYRPLAQICRSQGDAFQAAYYLSLSLMTDEPLATAREILLDIFENSRLQAEQFPVVTALTRMSQQEHISHFQPHFLAAVGIAYSRTSADMFSHHMERCRRHLSTTLQLLTIDILHDLESGRGHKGDFTQFDQFGLLTSSSSSSASSMSAATAVGNEIFFSKASELSDLIRKTVVIIISLLESLSNKHHLKDFYHSVNWNHSYSTPSNPNANGNSHSHKSGGSSSGSSRRHVKTNDFVSAAPSAAVDLSLEEKLVFEKRYTIQCLHKVQCIPGFLDLARLLLGLIATLISSEGVGIGSRTGVSSHVNENKLVSTILLVTSCPAISLFFDWISEHPEFQIISVLDKTAWEQMESDLAVYLSTLAHWTLPKQISVENKQSAHEVVKPLEFDAKGCLLEEDFALQGFLPLLSLFQRRSDQFQKTFAALPHVVESLDSLKNGQGNTDTESLSKICQPLPLLSSLSHSSRLVVHAHRCVDTVRTLCNQPVVFGHDANGIFFDKHRQTLYPSSPDSKFDHSLLPLDDIVTETTATRNPKPDPKHCLCVIVYKAPLMMRSAGFMSSGHGSKQSVILTEEEFLRGSAALTEELFLASSPQDHLEPSIEAAPSEAPQSALQETEVVLDLIEAEDTGEIFPEEFKPLEEERQKKEKPSTPVSLPSVTPLGEQQQQQQGKGVLRISAPSSMKRAPAAPPAPLSQKARQLKETAELPLIVIDTPNVAMRHGLNTKFSCRGIKLAIDFFHSAGHRVVAFLPVPLPSDPLLLFLDLYLFTFRISILTSKELVSYAAQLISEFLRFPVPSAYFISQS
jgi:hypothetical protein